MSSNNKPNQTQQEQSDGNNKSDKQVISAGSDDFRVTITEWTQVGTWKWVANDETCGVCRMVFEAACSRCKYPGDDCPVVAGQCRHSFHMHCIMDWLQSQQIQQQCPLCRQEWKFPNMTTG